MFILCACFMSWQHPRVGILLTDTLLQPVLWLIIRLSIMLCRTTFVFFHHRPELARDLITFQERSLSLTSSTCCKTFHSMTKPKESNVTPLISVPLKSTVVCKGEYVYREVNSLLS